jgi:hypothetical protein
MMMMLSGRTKTVTIMTRVILYPSKKSLVVLDIIRALFKNEFAIGESNQASIKSVVEKIS